MIPTKTRESRRAKSLKLPKNLERLYKEGKCRECAVVVTRMDFAKILGKFTKVKIQYESSTTTKSKQNANATSPNSNARLKSNENGMVLIHRKAYSQHPVKELNNTKKLKNSESPHVTNILKENNRLKKTILLNDKNTNVNDKKEKVNNNIKHYGIIFEDPMLSLANNNNNNDINCKISLTDLLPLINEGILPSEEWCIDYFPKNDEPKDDQVYDRIAAELEDLMYNEKPLVKMEEKLEVVENKVDDFPSIMDILNDNSSDNKQSDQNSNLEYKSNLESSDVEAMLLGKSNPTSEIVTPAPMDIDTTTVSNLIEDVNQLTAIQETITSVAETASNSENNLPLPMEKEEDHSASSINDQADNPHSPSILDETLQKGIEEHLPIKIIESNNDDKTDVNESTNNKADTETNIDAVLTDPKVTESETKVMDTYINTEVNESSDNTKSKEKISLALKEGITHVVFKMTKDGACVKSVTCPKNLKYCVEIDGKSIEFIGAPKSISSLEDLQVLLQIVNESELDSLYVLH